MIKKGYEAIEVVDFHPVAGISGFGFPDPDWEHVKLYIRFRIVDEVFYDTLDIVLGSGYPAYDRDYNKKKR